MSCEVPCPSLCLCSCLPLSLHWLTLPLRPYHEVRWPITTTSEFQVEPDFAILWPFNAGSHPFLPLASSFSQNTLTLDVFSHCIVSARASNLLEEEGPSSVLPTPDCPPPQGAAHSTLLLCGFAVGPTRLLDSHSEASLCRHLILVSQHLWTRALAWLSALSPGRVIAAGIILPSRATASMVLPEL